MIEDSLRRLDKFRGHSLRTTIADIESRLVDATKADVAVTNATLSIDNSIITSAAQVKRASAQIDVIIHALGILFSLPFLLKEGEQVETTSLGAGNAGSEFDVVTNYRVAEFKFINWQGGSEAVRKKTFFQDYFKLVRDQSGKTKYFYLLNTVIPIRFLKGRSKILRMLDRDQRLALSFQKLYGDRFQTVGEFYNAYKNEVQFVNLIEIIPELGPLIGLPMTKDESI